MESAPEEMMSSSEAAGEHFHITAESLGGFLLIASRIAAFLQRRRRL